MKISTDKHCFFWSRRFFTPVSRSEWPCGPALLPRWITLNPSHYVIQTGTLP